MKTKAAVGTCALGSLVALLLSMSASGQSPRTYTTQFNATENPISEGGAWVQQGGLTGLDWTNVRTSGGIAYGTQNGSGGYDDSIAFLSGYGPNYRVTATVHFVGSRSGGTESHEAEIHLRGNFSAHSQRTYECNLGYSGTTGWYMQIFRLNGPIGTFTEIGTLQVGAVPAVQNGDIFMAEVNGSVISSYLNGVKMVTATDSTYPTGQPGIGFFWRGTENVTDLAFTSLTVTEIGSGATVRPNPPTGVRVD
jgi:hypothetical protein